jgi:hypothetical protein
MSTEKYTPSINLKRDFDSKFDYVKTPNAQRIYDAIISNYQKGSRSFNLIGAYGTGKSSFVLAFEQSLCGKNQVFERTSFHDKEVKVINIIGEYASITDVFAERFGLNEKDYKSSSLIERINRYTSQDAPTVHIIVIDEFGKFLEYAAKNNPEKELYFIQQLAELVNDLSKDLLLITILHKNFNAYSLELSKTQIDEWNKVKGRLYEINFNEPVEQLLFLASVKIQKLNTSVPSPDLSQILYKAIEKSKLFSYENQSDDVFLNRIFPLDILSASILTLALQEYAQNERSLFSFIEDESDFGLKWHINKSNSFFDVAKVYDYLNHHFYSFLTTKYNPHLNQWNAIKYSIEKAESIYDRHAEDAIKLIKVIGMLNIFSSKGGAINDKFIKGYSEIALSINDPQQVLQSLLSNKIVHYTKYDNRYKLLHGTDLDFELAINEAGRLIERIKDITLLLNRYFDFPVISAKRVSYKKGTPRFFSFIISDEVMKTLPQDDHDGFINLIFSETTSVVEIIEQTKDCQEAILFGYYANTAEIERTLFEIEKVAKVIEANSNDNVAVQELKSILNHYRAILNYYVIENLYTKNSAIHWIFNGEERQINSQRDFNNLLSEICETVYHKTPIFRNELVNKTKLSGTISFARKRLITTLLNGSEKPEFGFGTKKFPPEKMIFLSLIRSTGMYEFRNKSSQLKSPSELSLRALWDYSEGIVNQSLTPKTCISEIINALKQRPFKLKQGFIDIWIPIFLIAQRDNYALYQRDRQTGEMIFVPSLNEDIFDLVHRTPKDYFIRKFQLSPIQIKIFNKYRGILDQVETNTFSNDTFIETFRPFLNFYKSLTDFGRKTKRLSDKAILFRNALENSTEPEEIFFSSFPKSLGYDINELADKESKIDEFVIEIKETINEISSAFDRLINEIELLINDDVLGKAVDFPENKLAIQNRYKGIEKALLPPTLKVFYNRVTTNLNDRRSWISSLAQSVLGKSLDTIEDKEIKILHTRLIENFRALDNYNEITEKELNINKEDVIKLDITSFQGGTYSKKIHIHKDKMLEIADAEKSMRSFIKDIDKNMSIALLVKLLQDEIDDQKN